MRMNKQQLAKIRKGVVLFFCLVSAGLMWPVYPLFSRIDPILFGIPFSLLYLILLLVTSFLVLLGLYLLEEMGGGSN